MELKNKQNKNKKNLISVVMPIYNAEKYLSESIESILSQTYKNIEVILINDGSIDESERIINNYAKKDKRIKVISRENKGLIKSLNEGIILSKGEFIARMDADDISYSDRLEKQLNYMINNKVDILGSYINCIGNTQNKDENEKWFNTKITEDNLLDRILLNPIIAHPTVMIKKSILEEIGLYSDKYKCIEDYELWLRAIAKGKRIDNIDEVLLDYRMHNLQKSQTDENTLSERIACKINLYKEKVEKKKVLIWGLGKGGLETYNILEKMNIEIAGWIDSHKNGEFCAKKIYSDLNEFEKEEYLILVANSFNDFECVKILKEKKYKILEEYIPII